MDLSGLPEDPDNPMQEPTPKFVKQLQKKFPGLPADIFPRRQVNWRGVALVTTTCVRVIVTGS